MKSILLIILLLVIAAIVYLVVQSIYVAYLPGNRRLDNKRKGTAKASFKGEISSAVDYWVKRLVPKPLIGRLETYLYKTGQSYNWTVNKTIQSMFVGFVLGIFSCFVIILGYITFDLPLIRLLVAVLAPIVGPVIPLIIFRMERGDFIDRIIFQTPELLDIFDEEMVKGRGNGIHAIEMAARDLDGQLKNIMFACYKFTLANPGNLTGALDLMKERIDHPLYDQIHLMVNQYRYSGRAKKMLNQIQKVTKDAINTAIRKQTLQRNLIIAMVSIGILINLMLLVGVPLLNGVLGQFIQVR